MNEQQRVISLSPVRVQAEREKLLGTRSFHKGLANDSMRTSTVGGAIVVTAFNLGPGAAAFVLEPVYQKVIMVSDRQRSRS